jgi:hypothetical protein
VIRTPLTPGQEAALQNLGRKLDGEVVAFINIAAARSLCDLGLAQRSQEGWDLTVAGSEMLTSLRGPESTGTTPPLTFGDRGGPPRLLPLPRPGGPSSAP